MDNLATEPDCKRVYQHVLDLVMAEQIDPNSTLTSKEYKGAEWQLDHTYWQDGVKQHFFSSCQDQMTLQQVECALQVQRVVDITACIRLVK